MQEARVLPALIRQMRPGQHLAGWSRIGVSGLRLVHGINLFAVGSTRSSKLARSVTASGRPLRMISTETGPAWLMMPKGLIRREFVAL